MTFAPTEVRSREASERPSGRRLVRPGRSELLVATAVAGIGVFLLVATVRMDVTAAVNYLGPRFFPALVGGLLVLLGAALAIQVYATTRPGREGSAQQGSPAEQSAATAHAGSDWKPLGLTLVSLAAHLLLLQTAGWIIAGALLFWGVSYALGSRKVLRDLGISFIVSSAVQVAFSIGLDLTLPSGILIGVL